MIYLDYTASTPLLPEIESIYIRALRECFANPSSLHSAGVGCARRLLDARMTLAAALGVNSESVFFTSGGSESNNTAVFGAARRRSKRGSHIISSLAEHDSVRKPLLELEKEGFEVTFLRPERDGSVSPESVKAALRPDTVLVSLAAVNNETGAVNDIPAVKAALAGSGALLHSDCVQLFGKARHTQVFRSVDLASVCGHKIYAPKGAGALIVNNRSAVEPLILGGGQENGMRAGTENLPAVIAFAEAASLLTAGFAKNRAVTEKLNLRLREALSGIGGIEFISGGNAVPHILTFAVDGIKAETLVNYLSAAGICISAGSACKKGHESEALKATGIDAKTLSAAVRVSLSHITTESETDALIAAIATAKTEILH